MLLHGTYTATLFKEVEGTVTQLGEPVSFQVEQLRKGALEAADPTDVAAFWRAFEKYFKRHCAIKHRNNQCDC